MSRTMGDVSFTFSIGIFGGGCIMSVENASNLIMNELKEYGAHLDDLFYECNAELPKLPGMYSFSGESMYTTDCYGAIDDSWLEGEIKLLRSEL